MLLFFFKQKTAYEMRSSDWSSDVCSSDLVPTTESKGKAIRVRVIAGILWFLAIGAQVGAIILLFRPPINMTWIIILIAIDLLLVIIGSVLWKKSNRLDPASERDKFKFFMQSQLGLVASVVRSEEHTSELQSLMRISYAVFCLKKKNTKNISLSQ